MEVEAPVSSRQADFQANLDRVQTELAQQREFFLATDQTLANEAAGLTNAISGAGTNRDNQRLTRLQSDREHIRVDWNAAMQTRLEFARRRLQTIQTSRRNGDVEADLAGLIALLEREARNPPF